MLTEASGGVAWITRTASARYDMAYSLRRLLIGFERPALMD